jgi:hypothetical protein
MSDTGILQAPGDAVLDSIEVDIVRQLNGQGEQQEKEKQFILEMNHLYKVRVIMGHVRVMLSIVEKYTKDVCLDCKHREFILETCTELVKKLHTLILELESSFKPCVTRSLILYKPTIDAVCYALLGLIHVSVRFVAVETDNFSEVCVEKMKKPLEIGESQDFDDVSINRIGASHLQEFLKLIQSEHFILSQNTSFVACLQVCLAFANELVSYSDT